MLTLRNSKWEIKEGAVYAPMTVKDHLDKVINPQGGKRFEIKGELHVYKKTENGVKATVMFSEEVLAANILPERRAEVVNVSFQHRV